MLKHRNYSGIVEYDPDGKIFTGEVIGLRDVVTFQGRLPEELERSFRDSIDFYLEMWARDGVTPRKNVQRPPEKMGDTVLGCRCR
ncbi:MAG: type II toxin-antitoxin system HicB family antitoxin [Chloroflexota bacterium]